MLRCATLLCCAVTLCPCCLAITLAVPTLSPALSRYHSVPCPSHYHAVGGLDCCRAISIRDEQGILAPADAQMAVAAGVDGIMLSNHGGRQLDYAPSPVEMLPHGEPP